MMNAWKLTALGILSIGAIAGCSSERTVIVRNGPPCVGGVWIEGHYGPRGYWRPGHWRCPGVVEVVQSD